MTWWTLSAEHWISPLHCSLLFLESMCLLNYLWRHVDRLSIYRLSLYYLSISDGPFWHISRYHLRPAFVVLSMIVMAETYKIINTLWSLTFHLWHKTTINLLLDFLSVNDEKTRLILLLGGLSRLIFLIWLIHAGHVTLRCKYYPVWSSAGKQDSGRELNQGDLFPCLHCGVTGPPCVFLDYCFQKMSAVMCTVRF